MPDAPREGWAPFHPQFGVLITVAVHGSEGRQEAILAMVDTGASHTIFDRAVCARVGLVPTGRTVHAFGALDDGAHWRQFSAGIAFPSTVSGSSFLCREFLTSEGAVAVHGAPYECIIGRDILQFCVLTIDGPAGLFRLEVQP